MISRNNQTSTGGGRKHILSRGLVLCLLLLGGLNGVSLFAHQGGVIPSQSDTYKEEQQANTITVTGKVIDTEGWEVIGATVVLVEDTSKGAATNLDGEFTLANVPANGTLRISFVGMQTIEVPINGRTTLNITLHPDSELLDEVVVVGYGTQKKVNVTGAVATVDTKALEARPVQNVGQALQGVVPGLNFSQTNAGGALDSQMSFNIRGAGTIGEGSSSSPLVLIDGVEGNINALNPADIANISVLKDAASASIYGARGAFGVILITTKSGRAGRTSINYSGNVRFSDALQIPKMLDSYRFAQYFNEAAKNQGRELVFSEETLKRIQDYQAWQRGEGPKIDGTIPNPENPKLWALYPNANANTDWFEEMYKSWVPSHEHQLSISGGSEKVTYLVSGSILDQNGLIRHGKDKFNRYNMSGKITASINDWSKMVYSTRWIREDYSRPSHMTGLFFHNIARRWPVNPVKDPNGFYIYGNEIHEMKDGGVDRNQRDYLYQQLQFVFNPLENWSITLEGNYNTQFNRNHWDVLPIYGHMVDKTPYPVQIATNSPGYSNVSESAYKQNHFSGNAYTNYSFNLQEDHRFSVLAGMNVELMKTNDLGGSKKDLITPSVPTINTATNDKPSLYGGYNHWSSLGFFGRLNYDYMDKYLLEVNVRHDGASRFIDDKQWGTFPSVSLGWNIAHEDFFEPLRGHIGMLKLRASWGQLGNMNTNSWYPFFQSMPTGTANSRWLINGERQNTSGTPGIVSSLLTWETIESWDIGLDWSALNGRLTGSFDVFNRATKNMVGPPPELSSMLGTNPPKINNADMVSYGWELEAQWRDHIGDFRYGVRLVLSDDTQKITRYPNENGSLSTWRVGQIMGEIWGYETVGIAKTQEEMDAHLAKVDQSSRGTNWAAGDIMYADLNGDGELNTGANTFKNPGDRRIIGNSRPHYNYGITLDAGWKGIDFRVFLQGVGKRDFSGGGVYFTGANANMWQSPGFEEHWDFFRPEGHPLGANLDAYYPRPAFDAGNKNFAAQTRWLMDASYMRIKNIQIGYTLPQEWVQRISMQNLRVYVSADNLVTFTKMPRIFDPELTGGGWGSGKLYPLSRTVAVGLSVNF